MSKTTHLSTQILERSLEHIKQKLLVINPPELASVELLLTQIPKQKIYVSCQSHSLYRAVAEQHIPGNFEVYYNGRLKFDQALVLLPNSDLEIEMTLAWAAASIHSHGEIVLVGQNDAGIKSAKKTLTRMIGEVIWQDTARHSALYIAKRTVTAHAFALNDWWQSYEITVPTSADPKLNTQRYTIYSLPGVFSHGKLDEGTELLLETLREQPLQGKHILDWGAGAGAIGASLSLQLPDSRIDLVDNSALALESARKTVKSNKLSKCQVLASDVFTDLPDTYDAIVANPPFHKGHDTHYNTTEQFLTESANHLAMHGHMRLVANIFLHYESLLEEKFGYVRVLKRTNKYKILEVVKTGSEEPRKKKDRTRKKASIDEDEEFE